LIDTLAEAMITCGQQEIGDQHAKMKLKRWEGEQLGQSSDCHGLYA